MLFYFLVSLLSVQSLWGQGLFVKNQALAINTSESVALNLVAHEIEIKRTPGRRLLVEISVEVDFGSPYLAAQLMRSGRYDVEILPKDGDYAQVLKPKLPHNAPLLLNGKRCKEHIKYVIYVPDKVQVHNLSTLIHDKSK